MNKTANKEFATAPSCCAAGRLLPGALCRIPRNSNSYGLEVCKRSAIKYLNSLVNLNQRDAFWSLDRTHARTGPDTQQTPQPHAKQELTNAPQTTPILVLVLDPLIAAETP